MYLIKTIDEMTVPEIENRIEDARTRRLLLSIEYTEARNIKLAKLGRKSRDKLEKQLELLKKALITLDKALANADQRMQAVTVTKNEISYLDSQIEDGEAI